MNDATEKLLTSQNITRIRNKYYDADKIEIILDALTEHIINDKSTIEKFKKSELELNDASEQAAEIINKARQTAAQIQTDAEAKADEILENAVLRAAKINENNPVARIVKVKKTQSTAADTSDRIRQQKEQLRLIRESSRKILEQQETAAQNIRTEIDSLLTTLEAETTGNPQMPDLESKLSLIADAILEINKK